VLRRKLIDESSCPVLILPTHRSYMDFLLASFIYFTFDIKPPYIAAGTIRGRRKGRSSRRRRRKEECRGYTEKHYINSNVDELLCVWRSFSLFPAAAVWRGGVCCGGSSCQAQKTLFIY